MSKTSTARKMIERWGLGPVSSVFERTTRKRLRVLGYHGVEDERTFVAQLDFVVDRYVPVSGADVVRALVSGATLPDRAVWITFDDGYRSVVDIAAEPLAQRGIAATMFVCPGLIEHQQPAWFDVALEALKGSGNASLIPGDPSIAPMRRMKLLPDAARRRAVEDLAATLSTHRIAELAEQVAGLDHLERWQSLGHDVGNHTWDHPILTKVAADELDRQIGDAQHWLRAKGFGQSPGQFAFPNGDADGPSIDAAHRKGYAAPVLFDHQLAARVGDFDGTISRLRISSTASVARLESIMSGAHSTLLGARNRAKRVIAIGLTTEGDAVS